MRLQLSVALIACAAATTARAQPDVAESGAATARMLVYTDDDATSVVTTTADVEAAVSQRFSVGAHALVDAVSSASADVVSAATERWTENRVEAGTRIKAQIAGAIASFAYTRSQENDWRSNALVVAASRELFGRNTLVSASYGVTLNQVGRAADPTFRRDLDLHMFDMGVSQLVDPRTRVGGAYTLQYLTGYQASPYRYAPTTAGSRAPERHPNTRLRAALSGYVLRALTELVVARAAYRLYVDDWGIYAHTASLRLAADPAERFSIALEGRVYFQDQADFYQQIYSSMSRYMSNDRELSSFWDAGGTASVELHVGPAVVDAKVGVIYYEFANFTPLPRRTALIAGAGTRLTW